MLLTGLYQPVSGRILLDGEPVTDRNGYLGLFSAIFTDYHLFQHLLGPEPKEALVAEWLERLQMGSKLAIEDGFIADIDLSQGQRKRVALLLALAEQREVMLFDEWAADQDPQFRRIFYQVLLPRLKEMGKTVIAISHDDHYFLTGRSPAGDAPGPPHRTDRRAARAGEPGCGRPSGWQGAGLMLAPMRLAASQHRNCLCSR